MNIKEAAAIAEVSETTIRRWIKSGRLEAELQDGSYEAQYYISQEALEKAINYERPTIVVQNTNQASQQDLQRAIGVAIRENIATKKSRVEQGILQEINSLRSELEATKRALVIGLEERTRIYCRLLGLYENVKKKSMNVGGMKGHCLGGRSSLGGVVTLTELFFML